MMDLPRFKFEVKLGAVLIYFLKPLWYIVTIKIIVFLKLNLCVFSISE